MSPVRANARTLGLLRPAVSGLCQVESAGLPLVAAAYMPQDTHITYSYISPSMLVGQTRDYHAKSLASFPSCLPEPRELDRNLVERLGWYRTLRRVADLDRAVAWKQTIWRLFSYLSVAEIVKVPEASLKPLEFTTVEKC